MSETKVELKITDFGKKLEQELEKLGKLEVCCGSQQGKAAEQDGTDICDIAAWNEFGTVHIPARPFMREGIDNNVDSIERLLKREGQKLVNGETNSESLLKIIGLKMKDVIQESITEGAWEPNAPSTVAKKKSSKPLIDTGRMRQSVNYIIRERGAGR